MSMMGSSSTSEYIDIVGDNLADITTVATEVTAKLKSVEGIQKVSSNMEDTKPVFSFKVDPAQSNAQEISMQLSAMLNPIPMGQIELDGDAAGVVLDPMVQPQTEQDLKALTLMTAEGPKPLSQLATYEVRNEPAMLFHKDGKPYVRITAEVDPKKVSEIGANIKKKPIVLHFRKA